MNEYFTSKPCPTCKAPKGERCRTTEGKKTDTHNARFSGVANRRNVMRPKKQP
jgi:hypothetical protein